MGAALFGLGLWIRTDEDFWEYENSLSVRNYYQATYIVIAVGAILLIMGFIGCCGAATESPCLLFNAKITATAHMSLFSKHEQYVEEGIGYRTSKDSLPPGGTAYFVTLLVMVVMELAAGGLVWRASNGDKGCGENLRRYLASKGGIIGGLAIGLVLIQKDNDPKHKTKATEEENESHGVA
ncbi:tetraspanin-8-like [Tachypleus tridentatus]|uniref:tetraspanin-8-like n=1 Tax=Tachypleus tridentatus TaxID=6853 RepID=UPI003FD0B8F5